MSKEKQKQNAVILCTEKEKEGKKYYNFFAVITLENGETFSFQFQPKFLNRKSIYKLRVNLPKGE